MADSNPYDRTHQESHDIVDLLHKALCAKDNVLQISVATEVQQWREEMERVKHGILQWMDKHDWPCINAKEQQELQFTQFKTNNRGLMEKYLRKTNHKIYKRIKTEDTDALWELFVEFMLNRKQRRNVSLCNKLAQNHAKNQKKTAASTSGAPPAKKSNSSLLIEEFHATIQDFMEIAIEWAVNEFRAEPSDTLTMTHTAGRGKTLHENANAIIPPEKMMHTADDGTSMSIVRMMDVFFDLKTKIQQERQCRMEAKKELLNLYQHHMDAVRAQLQSKYQTPQSQYIVQAGHLGTVHLNLVVNTKSKPVTATAAVAAIQDAMHSSDTVADGTVTTVDKLLTIQHSKHDGGFHLDTNSQHVMEEFLKEPRTRTVFTNTLTALIMNSCDVSKNWFITQPNVNANDDYEQDQPESVDYEAFFGVDYV